jgi:hypothetical protein
VATLQAKERKNDKQAQLPLLQPPEEKCTKIVILCKGTEMEEMKYACLVIYPKDS